MDIRPVGGSSPTEGLVVRGEVAEQVRSYLMGALGLVRIGDDEPLLGPGRLTSLRALRLVQWLERTFSIEMTGTDLRRDNFQSVAALANLVVTKAAPQR